MAQYSKIEERSLRRIEKGEHKPKLETLLLLIKSVDLPEDGFIYLMCGSNSMETAILCDQLNQSLDMRDTSRADSILARLEATKGFDSDACFQFIYSKKARLLEQLGKESCQIVGLIEEGMALTYSEFNEKNIVGSVFILEETELLHTRARVYANDGDIDAAVRILAGMKANLTGLPMADREKESQFTPVLLSLSEYQLRTGDYDAVLEVCDLGAGYSAIRKQGRHNPEFEFNKSLALHSLGRTRECLPHLCHAYYGYMMLSETEKAKSVLSTADERFGIRFDLYGVDQLEGFKQQRVPYSRGEAIECDSIGTMIGALRDREGMSLNQLCRGICDKTTLRRIENDEPTEHICFLESIMQRFGRESNIYMNFFLSREDFISAQLRDRIDELLIGRRFVEAEVFLRELKTIKGFIEQKPNQQFVKLAESMIYASLHDPLSAEYPEMLLDALKITFPEFTERYIDRYTLTYNEVFIINSFAGYLRDTGAVKRASDIYARLRRNLNERYVDEVAKSRMFSTIISNYSSCLGREGKRREALYVIDEGVNFERGRGRLTMLPNLYFNKAYNMLKLGDRSGSVPYFALAYYGASMFAPYIHSIEMIVPVIKDHLSEALGIA